MLAPVPPVNPGTHSLGSGLSYTVGGEHVYEPLAEIVRSGRAAVDIETYGLGLLGREIKVVIFSDGRQAVILDIRDVAQAVLIRWAFQELRRMIFHNSPYDVPNLGMAGFWRPEWCWKVTDTLIWARLAHPSEHGGNDLESTAQRYLGITKAGTPMAKIFRELGLTKAAGYKRFDLDRPVFQYGAAMDGIMTARLETVVRKAAYDKLTTGHPWEGTKYGTDQTEAWRMVEREQILNRMFLARSVKGLRIDEEWADTYAESHREEYARATALLLGEGVKPGNAGTLITFLDAAGAIPDFYPRTEKTKAWSTAAENLGRLHHPVARAYVRTKQIDHVQKDYLAKCLELAHEGLVHPQVNLLAAVTGRMSMGNPPLHQFPGDARGIVLADQGDSLTSIDWSQIEPVIGANAAGDHEILQRYESGEMDFYAAIAQAAGTTRAKAKVALLAQLYGEGIKKLALSLGMSIEDTKDLVDNVIFQPIPKTRRLISNFKSLAFRYRKIFTLSGRILPISSTPEGGVLAYRAINYFIQGSAYDALAEALIRVHEAGLGEAVYLALHDELVVSSSAAEDVRILMAEPPTRLITIAKRTPVLRTDMADLGERWGKPE